MAGCCWRAWVGGLLASTHSRASLPHSASHTHSPHPAPPPLTPNPAGYRYEGEWYQGRRHGNGSIFLTNGDSFTGMWKEGKMDGPVVYKFADDSVWSNPDL